MRSNVTAIVSFGFLAEITLVISVWVSTFLPSNDKITSPACNPAFSAPELPTISSMVTPPDAVREPGTIPRNPPLPSFELT